MRSIVCAHIVVLWRRPGATRGIISCVGDDDFGRLNLKRLGADGADIKAVEVREGYATGSAFVRYREEGDRDFVYNRKWAEAALPETTVQPVYVDRVELVDEHRAQRGLDVDIDARPLAHQCGSGAVLRLDVRHPTFEQCDRSRRWCRCHRSDRDFYARESGWIGPREFS